MAWAAAAGRRGAPRAFPRCRIAACVLALGLLGGCAGLREARLALPQELSGAVAVELPFAGGRRGGFALPPALGGGRVSFEREADRWTLLELVQADRARLAWRWDPPAGASLAWTCRLGGTRLVPGALQLPVQPARLRCSSGAGAELRLEERVLPTRREQTGSYRSGALRLELRSAHALEGSALTLPEPGGYLVEREGVPVAVLDLLGAAPLLRAPPTADPALAAALRDLTLLLGLAWSGAPAD